MVDRIMHRGGHRSNCPFFYRFFWWHSRWCMFVGSTRGDVLMQVCNWAPQPETGCLPERPLPKLTDDLVPGRCMALSYEAPTELLPPEWVNDTPALPMGIWRDVLDGTKHLTADSACGTSIWKRDIVLHKCHPPTPLRHHMGSHETVELREGRKDAHVP